MTEPNQTLEDLRGKLLAISDQVYVPNETKDYTGVKIGVDINEAVALFQEYAQSMVVEELERVEREVIGEDEPRSVGKYITGYTHRELRNKFRAEQRKKLAAIKSQGSKENGNG